MLNSANLEGESVTVCIAAICKNEFGNQAVVMVSDRKFTAGSHTYQPNQTKHISFSSSVVGMIAGSISNHAAMCQSTMRSLAADPAPTVETVAKFYAQSFSELRARQAERALLAPCGLTLYSLTHDNSIPHELATHLMERVRRYALDEEFISAGIEPSGVAHLWKVYDPGWETCEDGAGYAAIGSGAEHAMAHFMHFGYTRDWTVARALFLAYSAKKRAETDPFVGSHTDVAVIGPGQIAYGPLNDSLHDDLEKAYYDSAMDEIKVLGGHYEQFEKKVEQFLKDQQQAAAEQQGGDVDRSGGEETGEEENGTIEQLPAPDHIGDAET